jgi:uncharacterized protein (DUF342 family)
MSDSAATGDLATAAATDNGPVRVGERITVALVPKVAEELQRLQARTNLSKTDLTNRAITLYEYINDQLSDGKEVLIRDKKTGETQGILIL